ncbi:Dopey, N-terminal [Rhizoctonia solani]|uniref:Dopey, N-terminal n=1 Tax=Rhizoctonia solani TaxID=456999 RepID=A0A8H7HH14_9AGAM|nr:Dopey, N-terminal [Rhizoctonia solani]
MSDKGTQATIVVQARDTLTIPDTLANDPKYKKYVIQVDKCLATFDNVHEWADFIAFLTKLLKAFQSYMQFKEIPRKLVVAKRLAQCLNPALPNGVHQRALDVYSHVLAVLGLDGLKRDLLLWSSGLFPFFEYAATSVKPALLNLYDTHFLPLGNSLRPATRAMILALLPGLEEEAGEFFDKVLALLDRLSGMVGPAFFFQSVWLVLVTSPTARAPALNLLMRRLPKLGPEDDLSSVVGSDVGLMIRAFAAALEDDNMLVRRGTLELLCSTLRMDGAIMKKAQRPDQTILMRAAVGVVLRRDLSLSRRLFAWLLGSSEQPATQVTYLKANGLGLLVSTLKDDMYGLDDTGDTRPFKIFVSLLDRWEIGGPLTELLIIDAFGALKNALERSPDNADLVTAASTLYEAIEPQILWQQLYATARTEILSGASDLKALEMISFIISTFKTHDPEVQSIHLPAVSTALAEICRILVVGQTSIIQSNTIQRAIRIVSDAVHHTPSAALLEKLELSQPAPVLELPTSPLSPTDKQMTSPTVENRDIESSNPPPYGAVSRADTFYGITPSDYPLLLMTERPVDSVPFCSLFEDAVTMCKHPFVGLGSGLMNSLLLRLKDKTAVSVTIEWQPEEWIESIIRELQTDRLFAVVDSVIGLVIRLCRSSLVTPALTIGKRPQVETFISLLLGYLRPEYTPYHVRGVQLLWELQATVSHREFESVVAKTLSSQKMGKSDAYEAFGVFWRLTDDSLVPGYRCKTPLLIVLDTLKSEDIHIRRVGETWMRCSLKSYIRVIEPVLFDLLDPSIKRASTTFTFNGRDTRGYTYERSIDQRKLAYVLESLLSVIRYGGQGFGRVARTTLIQRSLYPGLMARAEAAQVAHPNTTFLDVLIEVLLRILQSEPKPQLAAHIQTLNGHLHTVALDTIQAIVSRGEVDLPTLETIEATIVSKLYMSVHTDRVDLQNKLLHVLHSTIFAATSTAILTPGTAPGSPRLAPGRIAPLPGGSMDELASADSQPAKLPGSINPLLIQTITDGITRTSHTPILQHWMDFVLMTIPHFQQSQAQVVLPLVDCVCKQLRVALESIQGLTQTRRNNELDHISHVTDAEFIVLLNALERLVLLAISRSSDPGPTEEDDTASEKEISGLFGIVSTVFNSDSHSNAVAEKIVPLSPSYRCLFDSISVLHSLWIASAWNPSTPLHAIDESISLTYGRARMRCRKVFERVFRVQSADVLDILVDCWDKGEGSSDVGLFPHSMAKNVDLLAASAQTVIHMLCESISMRSTTSLGDRGRRATMSNATLSDITLFRFMQEYLAKLEGPVVNQVWTRLMSLLKDITANVPAHRSQVFPALKCLIAAAEKQAMTTALDDRRTKKELQDTMAKLIDACLHASGRSIDGLASRKGTREALASGSANGRASPLSIHRVRTDSLTNEKIVASPADDSAKVTAAWETDLPDEINLFFARRLIPNLRKFMVENDKVVSVCANIVYYVINPAIRSKVKNAIDNQPTIMIMMEELVKQQVAVRAWRPPLAEAFDDQRFFARDPDAGSGWCPLIRAYILSDKLAVPDIVGRVTTTSSNNIFTNREAEALARTISLRRLSFAIYCGETNGCLTHLPSIQEKLVELLRSTSAEPIVHSEVFLCVRILLCRLSPHNLSSFWPVILTELIRIFDLALVDPPTDNSDELLLLLAACKCVDLMLVLQTPEFQIHQWMFVTDTLDAVYRPDGWNPASLMDQLAEVIGSLPKLEQSTTSMQTAFAGQTSKRRPLLGAVRRIERLGDLIPFFSHVSIALYEGVYAGASPDMDEIERGFLEEMFGG